jgi:hypothetical protein
MCPASRTLSGACRALRSWDAGRTACAWHVKEATLWPVTTQRHQIRSATCSLVGEILKPLGCPVYTGVPASPLYPIASWSYRASPPLARQLSGELQFLAEKRPWIDWQQCITARDCAPQLGNPYHIDNPLVAIERPRGLVPSCVPHKYSSCASAGVQDGGRIDINAAGSGTC